MIYIKHPVSGLKRYLMSSKTGCTGGYISVYFKEISLFRAGRHAESCSVNTTPLTFKLKRFFFLYRCGGHMIRAETDS